ncbi:MAG: response regulator transcription factor [Deltaproteobacteria bacterium]|nr:response regulator transcription factor [Deltaproteobacteria bacterium]
MSERARSGPPAAAAPHVVIADPDPDTRTRMAACVRAVAGAQGLVVTIAEAKDGTTALALMGERRPRLLLCEALLEGISGFALLRRVHAEWGAADSGNTRASVTLGRRLPPPAGTCAVVFVSSMSRDADRYWGLRQGAFAYLGKPFTDDALEAAIRKALAPAHVEGA